MLSKSTFRILKVVPKLRISSTDASTLEVTLQLSVVQTWIPISYNTRTARNENTLLSYIMCMVPNTSSVMVHTKLNIIERWHDIVRLTQRLTLPSLKQRKKSYAHTLKCINYKEEHQANNNSCLFWRHWFNKKWYLRKYQELCENKSKSIHLVVGKVSIWFIKT